MNKVNCFQCTVCQNIYVKASSAQLCETEHGLIQHLKIKKCIGYSKSNIWADLVILEDDKGQEATYQLYKVD